MSEQEEEKKATTKKCKPSPEMVSPMAALSDDLLLQILARLEGDPRDWARAACVSPRLAGLVRGVCFRTRLARSLPVDLLPAPEAAAAWAALQKLSVCCPGLMRAGVLLEHSDFGLEQDIGPDLTYPLLLAGAGEEEAKNASKAVIAESKKSPPPVVSGSENQSGVLAESKNSPPASSESKNSPPASSESKNASTSMAGSKNPPPNLPNSANPAPISSDLPAPAEPAWSLFDDLYLDTVYDGSEAQDPTLAPTDDASANANANTTTICRGIASGSKRRQRHWVGPVGAHLASGPWSLSREQGNKLLASRFRGDCLYICDWPGCVHAGEKRKYMVFRGVFKNFKWSRVWRTIRDTKRGKVGLECAFCACKESWDLHSAFCLRSFFGFHDDGEPVVRAYVCENGHVAGAWTERPMYA